MIERDLFLIRGSKRSVGLSPGRKLDRPVFLVFLDVSRYVLVIQSGSLFYFDIEKTSMYEAPFYIAY